MNLSCSGEMLTGFFSTALGYCVAGVRSTGATNSTVKRAVIARVLQGLDDLLPVERTLARRHAVVVGDVEVIEPLAGLADRGIHVGILDIEMEGIEADAAIGADRFGQRQGLVGAVQDIGLEAVERLDGDAHALLLAVLVAFLDALDEPLPFLLGRSIGRDLADGRRNQGDDLAFELARPW